MKSLSPSSLIPTIQAFNSTHIESWPHSQLVYRNSIDAWPCLSYKSSTYLAPYMNITRYSEHLSDGYIFFTPAEISQDGEQSPPANAYIMNMDGQLIYAAEDHSFDSCDEWVAGVTDFRAQVYNGRPHLTCWNGCNTKDQHWGYRWGSVTFIDEEYQMLTFNPHLDVNTNDLATSGYIDMHEHEMTDRNTIIVTSYNITRYNGLPVADGLFFEIDITTGEILFEWHALDHLDMAESHWECNGAEPCDWIHLNSVQAVGDNYLISARHLFAVYLISGKDGSIIWELNGEGAGTWNTTFSAFRWQHHARATNVTEHGMTVSIFNNNHYIGGPKDPQYQSQALAFWIAMPPDPLKPPVLVRELQAEDEAIYSGTQGSYQFDVGGGNGFVGYGLMPIAREYSPEGAMLWQAQFGYENEIMSYRAFKGEWHGLPKAWDPTISVERSGVRKQQLIAYVSWNGATDIEAWAVFGGPTTEDLKPLGVAKKQGFETAFELNDVACIQVGAIRNGTIVRTSNTICREESRAVEKNASYRIPLVVQSLACFAGTVLSAICIWRA